MTEFWKEGNCIPVTLISVEPNIVTQIKTQDKDGYNGAQIGALRMKDKNLTRPMKGHLKDLEAKKIFREARNPDPSWQRGQVLDLSQFQTGELVTVTGTGKGKGFQGVVKRHHFAGGPASHGHKDNLRMPGAIGSSGVERVFKGVKMAGRMGGDRVTVRNLEVIKIDAEKNLLALKGAVPGARGSIIVIRGK